MSATSQHNYDKHEQQQGIEENSVELGDFSYLHTQSQSPAHKILMIHPRRGLFRLTVCTSCSYKWECNNCSCNLTTYRTSGSLMELICHQCQTTYSYPSSCPKCHGQQILSLVGGIDDLAEKLSSEYEFKKR
jgi:primosomal protein N'